MASARDENARVKSCLTTIDDSYALFDDVLMEAQDHEIFEAVAFLVYITTYKSTMFLIREAIVLCTLNY